jgi:hypothetical protein
MNEELTRTENGVKNSSCTVHNFYYTKQLTQNFKTASFPHCSVQSNAESISTQYMPYSQYISDRTVNNKYLAGQTGTDLRTN